MRACFAFSLAILLASSTFAAAESAFPYLVHVASDAASLRSGPGEEFYATSQPPRGSELEVWRHGPDGWLAVRPPTVSFSLVSAADVRVQPDRLAEAVRPGVAVRVGSEMTANQDVVQVLLHAGERVEVLETIPLDGQFWHRIAPPSGEFRWIHARNVTGPNLPVGSLASQGTPSPSAELAVIENSQPANHAAYRVAPFSPASEASSPGSQLGASATEPPPTGVAGQTLADLVQGSAAADASQGGISLAAIEVEVATIVAEDPSLWQFAQLRTRCEELARAADSATREHIDTLLEKIARFERIRDMRESIASNRQAAVNALGATSVHVQTAASTDDARVELGEHHGNTTTLDRADTWRAARGPDQRLQVEPASTGGEVVRIPERSPGSAEVEGRYDGIGTLRPVVSRRRDAPRYALVDETGDVVTFITPSPGVNLQPYMGQRLGVVGTRGYMPEFKRSHITAARVMPLR